MVSFFFFKRSLLEWNHSAPCLASLKCTQIKALHFRKLEITSLHGFTHMFEFRASGQLLGCGEFCNKARKVCRNVITIPSCLINAAFRMKLDLGIQIAYSEEIQHRKQERQLQIVPKYEQRRSLILLLNIPLLMTSQCLINDIIITELCVLLLP